MKMKPFLLLSLCALLVGAGPAAAAEHRARDLGVPFKGQTGPLNAITDVKGVEVGQTTLIKGNGKLQKGIGPVRTGVTAIHPRGKASTEPVFASWFALNASGEMTGTTWLDERGLLDGPIMITNTHSVGVVRDAAVAWMVEKGWPALWHAPVAAETFDGFINDINGYHVTKEDALAAMRTAKAGPVVEGSVGGGTGMMCNGFKGGNGTSSRVLTVGKQTYTVGVFVQCNYGNRGELKTIAGVPVPELQNVQKFCYEDPSIEGQYSRYFAKCPDPSPKQNGDPPKDGSIIVVVATDAPLLPHQLKRLVKRPSLALGRLGAISNDGSGDIFIAFSTANTGMLSENEPSTGLTMHPNNLLSPLFNATIEATEEAIVNAMVAAETMVGADSLRMPELPEDLLAQIMARHAAANRKR
ncbi:DmpA family aminopeptidase [Sphingosinicella rhizophila]|uniref:P1 family peptidase n=1 Tax=Sphingosinicella rhizophila TaxID=3050082 RepID=A0ABU3Q7D2_9SPHN|nr:P1 family peptidase [Sphingosinicella sp. GR2756]MDT9598855.1 P1 family peptidase [Sphingosinicella sp. GR2756]